MKNRGNRPCYLSGMMTSVWATSAPSSTFHILTKHPVWCTTKDATKQEAMKQ
jgi:hypothetical protein